jgi:hypothetical protein
MQDVTKLEKMSLELHIDVARPLLGPSRPCQVTMIHVKHPKVIPHPWITLVFSLKGGGFKSPRFMGPQVKQPYVIKMIHTPYSPTYV